jgi:hypothetical protein
MRLRVFVLILALLVSISLTAQSKVAFTGDANELFSTLISGMKTGIYFAFFNKGLFDKGPVASMTQTSHWDPKLGSAGGVWEAQNASGYVSLRIWSPDMMDKTRDHALVVYQPATERPIPEALLAHLLTKAESTKISSGNTIELEFPAESVAKVPCTSFTTLTVRLDTGALVANSVRTLCNRS